jgi:rhodanese-related sulfurtransferase
MAAVTKVRNPKTSALRLRQGIRQGIFLVCLGALLAAGFNAIRPTGLPWIGGWSPASIAASRLRGLEEIPLQEAWSSYQEDKALFLDARDPVSFYEGHIKGALNCPPGEAESYLEEVMARAKSGLEVIAYCDGVDCPLSPELARNLQGLGVPSVKVLVDGWGRWVGAGFPIEKGGG